MNKKRIKTAIIVLLLFVLAAAFCGCGKKNEEVLSDEVAISAIKNYCCMANPDLEEILNDEEYPVYWEIFSSDENEIVVLFRSYTGAQNKFYIDRATGDTYVTEFVPGITTEEQKTDISFDINELITEE